METNYTNIKHFKFNSVTSSTINTIQDGLKPEELISLQIMEDKFNGIEVKLDKNYFINSLIPFLSELNDKEKETFKNWLGQ